METDQELEQKGSSNALTENAEIKRNHINKTENEIVISSPPLQSSNMNINDSREKQNPSTSIENIRSDESNQDCESNQEKIEKETDDWEVVEVSSNASEGSDSTECDVKMPLKQLDKEQTSYRIQDISNQNKNIPTSEMERNPDEDCILIESDLENISPQSTNSNPSQNETQKTNIKTTDPNAIKKRKFKLFTGDSSDDEVAPEKSGHKMHAEKDIPAEKNLVKDLQPVVEENNQITKNNETFKSNGTNTKSKNNETFSISNPKSVTDIELTDDNFPLKQQTIRGNNREHDLPELQEESDNETGVVPQSNNPQVVQSRNKTLTLDKRSRGGSCQCSCSSVPLVGSPNAKRVKRQRLMNQMLQESETKLKRKMVKKMKDVFVHVLESLIESSEESDILPDSDDQTEHLCKIVNRNRPKHGHPYSRTHQHHTEHVHNGNEPESMRDLKGELQYWKHRAKSKSEQVQLTPEEYQMKKMKDELNYWKKLATSKSEGQDLAAPILCSSAMARTSTPVKKHVEESGYKRSTARHQNGMLKVPVPFHSDPGPSHSQTEFSSSTPDYLNQDEPLASQTMQTESNHRSKLFTRSEKTSKESNPFQRDTIKNATVSRANNTVSLMSRSKFTEKEKQSMIEYLVEHYDTLELIKGNMFWMQMSHELDTQRSWQSLRSNFFQSIMKNLEQFEMPHKVRNKIISLAKHYM
uniref:Uncharacterized protein n=1 Tax=Cacopsylla melanoneura TaxID=428564 RepID=A0A8D8ST78_9HEMI